MQSETPGSRLYLAHHGDDFFGLVRHRNPNELDLLQAGQLAHVVLVDLDGFS